MKKIIFSLTVITLFVLGIFTVIVFNSSPLDPQGSVIPMFFTFGFAVAFLVSFLSSLIVLSRRSKKPDKQTITKYLRRSVELSAVLVGMFAMSAYGVLNALSVMSFVLAIFLIDLFVESKITQKNKYE